MKIVIGVAKVFFVGLLFHLSATILGDRYEGSLPAAGTYSYGTGNAPDVVRSEIIETLSVFQDGYAARDQVLLADFMDRLFSKANTTIIGTMPREIYVGFEEATDLVRTDWESWGDCFFDIENVHISNQGDTAWFATVGYVEFDLSRFLVLPLRLSGVLVREDGGWQFQYLQFQFDLDLVFLLPLTALLGIWLVVQVAWLAIDAFRRHTQPRSAANS